MAFARPVCIIKIIRGFWLKRRVCGEWNCTLRMPSRFVEIGDPIGNGIEWVSVLGTVTVNFIDRVNISWTGHVCEKQNNRSILGTLLHGCNNVPAMINATHIVPLGSILPNTFLIPRPRCHTVCLAIITASLAVIHWVYVKAKARSILNGWGSLRKTD
jgi:hypothetical protein